MTWTRKERIALVFSLSLVMIIFFSSVWYKLHPPEEVLIFTVFDVYEHEAIPGTTMVLTYGIGKFKFKGEYWNTFELDKTYRVTALEVGLITYQVLEIEELG